jgi:two-component system, chemotaxis family, chemotaxis protein CheY
MAVPEVLIIDDDPINNLICEKILQIKGISSNSFSFTSASKALEFLGQIKGETPAAILLDLNLPEVDGWQFLEKFKLLNIKTPIFILTSSIDPRDKNRSETYKDVKGFFTKPLIDGSLEIIRDTINQAV